MADLTPAEQAREAIARRWRSGNESSVADLQLAGNVLRATLPDGRTIGQALSDGAIAERIVQWRIDAVTAPERHRPVPPADPEAAEYLHRKGLT